MLKNVECLPLSLFHVLPITSFLHFDCNSKTINLEVVSKRNIHLKLLLGGCESDRPVGLVATVWGPGLIPGLNQYLCFILSICSWAYVFLFRIRISPALIKQKIILVCGRLRYKAVKIH